MWIGLLVGALVVVLVLLASLVVYHIAFFAPKKGRDTYTVIAGPEYTHLTNQMTQMMEQMASLPCEQVTVIAQDGRKLHGRYYHLQDGAPLQIQFHGYRGHPIRDFCGGHQLARELGHNTLVVDQRAHGQSEGTTIAFGHLECHDCLTWVNYVLQRFGKKLPIFLVGVSMGASTVLMAAGFPLPSNVRGIIADCPYSSSGAIIRRVIRQMHLPPAFVYPLAVLGARLFGHFRLTDKQSPIEAVKRATVPILLLHGEADHFVPCQMSRDIYNACVSPKTLVTFPGAAHGVSYLSDPARYQSVVKAFTAH